jgi:hypothetical protein
LAQASYLQAKLLPSYLATVKTIKRAVKPPPPSLTPLSSYLSLLSLPFFFVFSPLSFLFVLSSPLLSSPLLSSPLLLSLFLLSTFPLHFYNKALKP